MLHVNTTYKIHKWFHVYWLIIHLALLFCRSRWNASPDFYSPPSTVILQIITILYDLIIIRKIKCCLKNDESRTVDSSLVSNSALIWWNPITLPLQSSPVGEEEESSNWKIDWFDPNERNMGRKDGRERERQRTRETGKTSIKAIRILCESETRNPDSWTLGSGSRAEQTDSRSLWCHHSSFRSHGNGVHQDGCDRCARKHLACFASRALDKSAV